MPSHLINVAPSPLYSPVTPLVRSSSLVICVADTRPTYCIMLEGLLSCPDGQSSCLPNLLLLSHKEAAEGKQGKQAGSSREKRSKAGVERRGLGLALHAAEGHSAPVIGGTPGAHTVVCARVAALAAAPMGSGIIQLRVDVLRAARHVGGAVHQGERHTAALDHKTSPKMSPQTLNVSDSL
ncbi:hypothetical protein EYF80_007464 [Liparis tanakae]|uniref:Uncharacterized protein n=1 Tax=Liparis tanakae TaxID=230148 RepID=A0A4Z2IYS9_9TELE|nr:hypothetical protein EYF80_007464 [Liparis tanakae]